MMEPLSTVKESGDNFQPGMPVLEQQGRSISWFEFLPLWLFYVPVALQWALLAVRYRSLSLPLIANPAVFLSGMVGASKSSVFEAAGAEAKRWILPWCRYRVGSGEAGDEAQVAAVLTLLKRHGLAFPVVIKPELGCRGVGVKLLQDEAALRACLPSYPAGADVLFQQLAPWEAEAGIFYVREPDAEAGVITSLTLKYTPYITGDGRRTLAQLVAADPRAGQLQHLYKARNAERWGQVLAAGERHRLLFSASHCRGAVFRDARGLIGTELSRTLDDIFADIPGFHYGRLDVKFKDIESLRAGRDFAIIEVNGASSESINIWDRNAGFGEALGTLLRQYRTLFRIGAANRRRGHRPPGMAALIRAWRMESRLVKHYPPND